jgi:hypothetical protein
MFQFSYTTTPSEALRRASRSSSPVKPKHDTRSIAESDPNEFEQQITAPPSALTFSPAHQERPTAEYSDEDEEDFSTSTRQFPQRQSRESFLGKIRIPPLITPQSKRDTRNFSFPFQAPEPTNDPDDSPMTPSQTSPTKNKYESDFIPTLTGDTSGQIKIESKRGPLADWFQGSSDPVTLGVLPSPTKEASDDPFLSYSTSEMDKSNKLQKKSPVQNLAASTSRFSFFSSKPALEKKPEVPEFEDDEFLNLDISSALFPGGSGSADPFSPAAFKNLLMNSEGLLLRLQTAYKLRTMALHELTADKDAQEEELEETETRVQHLKLQLDDMAQKSLDHEKEMAALRDELASERKARKDEEEARTRSVLLVKADNQSHVERSSRTPRHGKRDSMGTFQSDSGFESEGESSASSVFSRGIGTTSPALTTSSSATASSSDPNQRAEFPGSDTRRPSMPPKRASTFQKVLKGMASPVEDEVELDMPIATCANCQGMRASEAWGVVGILREENKGLKQRVGNLEGEVEACLDLVRGIAS